MTIRVLLVDDHAVVREGYRRLIEKHQGISVVAEAEDAASGYQAFKCHGPDVVVVDVSMPGRGGIDLVRQIRQLDCDARILIFTMHASATYAQQAFRAGARGYVTKSSPPDVLVSAIRSIYSGRPALCAEINEIIAASSLSDGMSVVDELSPRAFEILRMILEAKSTDEIAAAFNLSPKTVANYHYEIKSKLGVRSDIELVYLCMRQGLVAPLAEQAV
ncbi:two component transcriptional regulator, LuxR family [Filomicrobium insigne]|uniref:Two component transcriptional regulator, LuxR family n=1 Tax=Filomicrobium insigne TaxID=418854 RepID=A0A1H0S8W9_9HYPH|nr:response regulator transcription factor [Filomicrobium insigne]SDP37949.1 two component transcriptional regulator, LuxR family [Filomicrobium insigne]